MGWNDHMPTEEEFTAIAIEAGAVKTCPIHDDVTINQHNPEAERRAYAIATNRWKSKDLIGDREDLMGSVKEAIEMSGDSCPMCGSR